VGARSGVKLAPVLAGVEFCVLQALERARPLRAATESKRTRETRNLIVAAIGAVPTLFLEAPLARCLATFVERRRWGLLARLALPPALETLLSIVLLDYTLFVWHMLTHRVPLLWRFHAVHHVDRDLDATTALRFHAGELTLAIPWRLAQIAAIGVTPRAYTLWQTCLVLSILFHHSNVRLPERWERLLALVIVTPRAHGIHHATSQRLTHANWSSGLSCWDRLHGTWRTDVAQADIAIGLPAYRDDRAVTLGAILLQPFRVEASAFDPA